MVGGGFSSIVGNLIQMATPNEGKYSFEQITRAINMRKHKLKLPACGEINKINHNVVRINRNAYAGMVCDLVSGATRGHARLFSSKVASYLIKKIYSMKHCSLHI